MDVPSNPCIRCGKERIKKSEKNVILNNSPVKLTIYVCPDKECQKIVDAELAAKEAKRLYYSNRNRPKGKTKETPSPS